MPSLKYRVLVTVKRWNFSYIDQIEITRPFGPSELTFTHQQLLPSIKRTFPRERLLESFLSRNPDQKDYAIDLDFEIVFNSNGPWVKGLYFAHEYNRSVPGKIREISYNNGFSEYEVKCLDKSLIVMDGFWQEADSNGCGDRFYADKSLKKKIERETHTATHADYMEMADDGKSSNGN